MISGLVDRLGPCVDGMVEGCRLQPGRTWELAFALQLRCKMRNDQPGMRQSALEDASESLELFTRIGDRWGMAEALSGQSEAASFSGDFGTAARCAREAIALAESIGAEQEIPILQVRLGDALLGAGELEEGERQLLLGVASSRVHTAYGQGAGFFGSLVLAALRARQERYPEARALLEPLAPSLGDTGIGSMLGGLLEGMLGWLDAKEGSPVEGLSRLRAGAAVSAEHPMAGHVGETIALMLIPSAAHVLLTCARDGLDVGDDPGPLAATLLGAYEARQTRTVVHHLERQALEETSAGLRELLGDEAFDAARARGAVLDMEQTLTLLRGC
jgi:hypothetical protein